MKWARDRWERAGGEDANGVDFAVVVAAGVGPLDEPVAGDAGIGKSTLAPERIVAAGISCRDFAHWNAAVRIAFALVEAGGADQAERRPLGQMRRALAVVGQRPKATGSSTPWIRATGTNARGHCSLKFGSFLMSSIWPGSSTRCRP